jgi:uncharacterized iron-regulated protein
MAVFKLLMCWFLLLVLCMVIAPFGYAAIDAKSMDAKNYDKPIFVTSLAASHQGNLSILSLQEQHYKDTSAVLQRLTQAHVVYLGETHDRVSDHQAQLEIIRALQQQHPQLAIALEIFQRPFQPLLDQYLHGKITEAELLQRSEYQKRWGYEWEFYAPILRFAKEKSLALIALNTPTEVTRKVARQGLESLTIAERQWIPPRSQILLGPESYRQRMQQIYTDSHQGNSHSGHFDRFFLAQVLWDETMAEQIAKQVQKRSDIPVIVLVGQGHIIYGDGIPKRVQRRITRKDFTQLSVLLNPSEPTTDRAIADYFWYVE